MNKEIEEKLRKFLFLTRLPLELDRGLYESMGWEDREGYRTVLEALQLREDLVKLVEKPIDKKSKFIQTKINYE